MENENDVVVYDDYLGFSKTVSIILAAIFITSWIFGIITRFKEKKYWYAVARIFLGFNILWFLDLIYIIKEKSIFRMP